MSVPKIHALTLVFTVALAALAFSIYEPKPKPRPAPSPLSAIPAGATFVASVDLRRLRTSELGRSLLAAGRELPGVGRLATICGFDPSERVRSVVVASAGAELGIVASGELERERILKCAEAVIAKRGGSAARTPVSSFVTVRDRSGRSGELAVRGQGPALLGEGRYLRDMIDTLEGRAQDIRKDGVHTPLRERLGGGAALVATWKLEPGWLERVSGEPLADRSPLSTVRAAGLRIDVEPEIAAQGLLVCTSPADCDEVAAVLGDFSRDFGPLLSEELGENPLEGARIDRFEGAVRIRVTLSHERATAIVRRVALRLFLAPEPTAPEPVAPQPAPSSSR